MSWYWPCLIVCELHGDTCAKLSEECPIRSIIVEMKSLYEAPLKVETDPRLLVFICESVEYSNR